MSLLNGDPAGPGITDPELRNRYGLNFRVNDPPFLITEAQYAYNQGRADTGLAGGIRLGGWHHFGGFDDRRFDTLGLSLASTFQHWHRTALPGKQRRLCRCGSAALPTRRARMRILRSYHLLALAQSPGDRNVSDWYLDGGLIFSGLIASRPNDAFGASFLYTHISPRVTALEADIAALNREPPRRAFELSFELNYAFSLMPGWTLQPNIAAVINPSGDAVNPIAAFARRPPQERGPRWGAKRMEILRSIWRRLFSLENRSAATIGFSISDRTLDHVQRRTLQSPDLGSPSGSGILHLFPQHEEPRCGHPPSRAHLHRWA